MNIQARNLKTKRNRSRSSGRGSLGLKISVIFSILVAFGAIFVITNYRIRLNQDISNIEQETARYRKKIHNLEREIEALRVRKEKLSCWSHIRTRIVGLNLNLRMPEPYQVQKLVINAQPAEHKNYSAEAKHKRLAMNR
jgi:hypothetical protein